MAAELGSVELLVAPGTGHWTVPEAPDFVTAAVLDFLTGTILKPEAEEDLCLQQPQPRLPGHAASRPSPCKSAKPPNNRSTISISR